MTRIFHRNEGAELYSMYYPIIQKLGILSKYIIDKEIYARELLPVEFHDAGGFMRMRSYIRHRRNAGILRKIKVDADNTSWEFYKQYIEDNYPKYDAFLTNLAVLLKSVEAFYSLLLIRVNGEFDVSEEKEKLICIETPDSVPLLFQRACDLGPNLTHLENGEFVAKKLIKSVMEIANDQYKALKSSESPKKSKIA